MHAAIVWNPWAGRGRAKGIELELRLALEAQGSTCESWPTTERGSAARIVEDCAPAFDRLFVIGGDGTLREAAHGNLRRDGPLPMAHLPLGNANVVARELGIPLDARAAIPGLIAGQPAPFDVLWADETLVLAVVGIGFDGEAAALLDRARRGPLQRWYRWHGDSLYGAVGMFTLLKPGWRRLRLRLDGTDLPGSYTGCMVSNMRTYAKGWAPNPGANAQDGLFDFQALRPSLLPNTALSLVAAARHKPLSERLAARGQGVLLEVESRATFYWQADGDPMPPKDRMTIRMEPGVLPLVLPAPVPESSAGGDEL